MHHVRQEDLPFVGSSHEFVGAEQGNSSVSVFSSDKLLRTPNKGKVLLAHVIHLSILLPGFDDSGYGLAP